ncbi:MAG: hypothetical protein A2900_03375 [Candidatus Chisholmbacteria bacterium RIFCSPLOWO2_01_FULL_50_28]|uniref:Glycosyltransferase 2-like domain-containing protein n=1 Tax=Candidatus Chisholmbacteria bacterium RIFCSPHIGHO2_01_FULL_52_32 TaxID=1797591 RepID=A0A1G1VSY1_9BACT|nr:MAG: hypothetical protein A2786_03370 [Candidatus Chisholmbacteria bacterium RIFCSPHIGHO2_01_FULL_52_32]OGY20118.1 MAG: hypothetical protein A2900_03375 [Candidatus Chisholmbacteria bacterium RIFCSPLOWO2_01_FULL_50_28]
MHKVFILIPTHNRKELLRKCLRCVRMQSYKNVETVVIDDGTTDGTTEMLSREYPHVTALKGNGNLWWGGAMRMGVEHILMRSGKGDFVLLMNDDTTFDGHYVKKIVSVSLDHKRAIVGSPCYDELNKRKLTGAPVFMDWEQGGAIPLEVPSDLTRKKWTTDINTFNGRGTLVPIEVFHHIGNFSKRLVHYGADYEFFLRAKRYGIPMVFSFETRVQNSASPGGTSFKRRTISLKEWRQLLFSKRSKSNIITSYHLIRLSCPSRYKMRNYKRVLFRFLDITACLFPSLVLTSPFTGKRVELSLYDMRYFLHRLFMMLRGLLWCLRRKIKGLPC